MLDHREKTLLARTPDDVPISTKALRPIAVLSLSVRRVGEKLGPSERGRFDNDTRQTAARAEAEVQLRYDERNLGTVEDIHGRRRITGLHHTVPFLLEARAKPWKGIIACLHQ
jgi:hypothetical protein